MLVEDRERIARDLHDTVIQRLSATGLSLQGSIGLIRNDAGAAVGRVESAIDDLDLTVKQIRSAIFALESSRTIDGLRSSVLETVQEARGVLGFEPTLLVDGPVDTGVGQELASDLLATLGEALTNVARHAEANRVNVELTATHEEVCLRVSDDGVGPPQGDGPDGSGLKNMAARAARQGGTMSFRAREPSGAVLEWRAPRS